MRAVGDGGDAGVEQRQHGQEIADIHVVRPVLDREVAVERIDVFGEVGLGDDAAELVLPAMPVPVDDAGHDDHAAHLDDDGLAVAGGGGEIGADGFDLLAADQHVAFIEVADLGIDGDDGRALEQDSVVGPGGVEPLLDRGPFRRALLVIGARLRLRHRLLPVSARRPRFCGARAGVPTACASIAPPASMATPSRPACAPWMLAQPRAMAQAGTLQSPAGT